MFLSRILLPLSFLFLSSCTYSVIMNHTEGEASDVVDQTQDATADIKPNIEIPLKP